jgi:hypothetical protein
MVVILSEPRLDVVDSVPDALLDEVAPDAVATEDDRVGDGVGGGASGLGAGLKGGASVVPSLTVG